MNNTINCQTTFRANIDAKFLNAADAFLQKQPAKQYKQFNSAVRRFVEIPNSDHLTISYKRGFKDGKANYSLLATEEGKEPVLLTEKDMFRKLIQKFSYMNEYEFKIKTGLIK